VPPAAWPVEHPRGWTKRVNRPQTEAEEQAMERSIARSRPLGESEWVKRIAGRLGLQSTLRPRGRPKREPE
jgi:putative transposase